MEVFLASVCRRAISSVCVREPDLADCQTNARQVLALDEAARVCVQLQDGGRLDQPALKAAGVPGIMVLAVGVVHLLSGL